MSDRDVFIPVIGLQCKSSGMTEEEIVEEMQDDQGNTYFVKRRVSIVNLTECSNQDDYSFSVRKGTVYNSPDDPQYGPTFVSIRQPKMRTRINGINVKTILSEEIIDTTQQLSPELSVKVYQARLKRLRLQLAQLPNTPEYEQRRSEILTQIDQTLESMSQ